MFTKNISLLPPPILTRGYSFGFVHIIIVCTKNNFKIGTVNIDK